MANTLAGIFTEYTTTGTQDKINNTVIDSVSNENVITGRFLNNKARFRGTQEKQSIYVGNSNAIDARGGGFRGTDRFNTEIRNDTTELIWNPKFVYEPMNFAYTDLSQNTGKEEVYSILARETEYAMTRLFDNIGDMLYSTNSESSKSFSGLRHMIANTGSYGGLSRSTYTVLNPGDTSATGYDSSTTETTLTAIHNVISALTFGSIKPTVGITTPEIFDYIEALLEPTKRYDIGGYAQVTRDGLKPSAGALGAATGLDAIVMKGVPIVRDDKCPAGHLFFLNEKELKFHYIPFGKMFGYTEQTMKPSVVQGNYDQNIQGGHKTGISYSGLKEPVDQAAAISQFILAGEFICRDPRKQGALTALTS